MLGLFSIVTGFVVGDVYGSLTIPDDFGSGSVGSSNSSGIGELTH